MRLSRKFNYYLHPSATDTFGSPSFYCKTYSMSLSKCIKLVCLLSVFLHLIEILFFSLTFLHMTMTITRIVKQKLLEVILFALNFVQNICSCICTCNFHQKSRPLLPSPRGPDTAFVKLSLHQCSPPYNIYIIPFHQIT